MISKVMNTKYIIIVVVTLFFSIFPGKAQARQDLKPFSKSEVLALIRQAESGPHEVSQGDIAVEVQRRGVDFAVDDRILDEFHRAGARTFLLNAIKRAVEESSRPRMDRR